MGNKIIVGSMEKFLSIFWEMGDWDKLTKKTKTREEADEYISGCIKDTKEDYGYYKINSDHLPFQFPKDSSISYYDLKSDKNKNGSLEKLFNMEQLSIETLNLREYISEKFKPLDFIQKNKQHVEEKDINKLKGFREKISV